MPLNPAQRKAALARISVARTDAGAIRQAKISAFLIQAYDRFVDAGLADPNFHGCFLDPSPAVHEQRVSEILLADYLWAHGFALASDAEGPDLRATKHGRTVWIELVTPEPTGIDPDHLKPGYGRVTSFPHEAINLRWTAAIKEKALKLLGDPSKGKQGYLEKRIVPKEACYIIAVNQHLLHGSFRQIEGISGKPAPVEVLFGVGPIQLKLNRSTGAVVDRGHMHRPTLPRGTKAAVPAETFLDPAFSSISAVWGLDLCLGACIGLTPGKYVDSEHLSALVHNPLATQPLAKGFLPSQSEWACTPGPEGHVVRRII